MPSAADWPTDLPNEGARQNGPDGHHSPLASTTSGQASAMDKRLARRRRALLSASDGVEGCPDCSVVLRRTVARRSSATRSDVRRHHEFRPRPPDVAMTTTTTAAVAAFVAAEAAETGASPGGPRLSVSQSVGQLVNDPAPTRSGLRRPRQRGVRRALLCSPLAISSDELLILFTPTCKLARWR